MRPNFPLFRPTPLGLLLSAALSPLTRASDPVHCEVTSHWYEVVPHTAGTTWTNARDAAKARGGYLVTITSAKEQAFIDSLLALENPPTGAIYIGLEEKAEGTYTWITGEKLDYTHWLPAQPDNAGGESRGSLLWNHETFTKTRDGYWNDIADSPQSGTCDYCNAGSSMIEYNQRPTPRTPLSDDKKPSTSPNSPSSPTKPAPKTQPQ